MRGMLQWRQAVVWGCVAWFSNCPWNDVRTNAVPLEFGMTPDVVATALGVPIVHVSGSAGNGGGASSSGRLYGFHLTGVTASGVPLLELTQPDAVRLHGLGSL